MSANEVVQVNAVKVDLVKNSAPYIKGVTFQLAERWKIKIGGLTDYNGDNEKLRKKGLPIKYDHFLITKLGRDQGGRLVVDDEVMKQLQGNDAKLTKIDITLLYDDPAKNMPSFYAIYSGGYRACFGDGNVAQRRVFRTEKDPDTKKDIRIWLNEWKDTDEKGNPLVCRNGGCEHYLNGKCKMHAILSVVLSDVPEIGGVARFRTTSEATIKYIYGGMMEVMLRSQGILAGIPLRLILQAETADTKRAGRQTVYRVALVYPGTDESLRNLGVAVSQMRAQTYANMKAIEKHISVMPIETREEAMAITQEFYPDNVETGVTETSEDESKQESSQGEASVVNNVQVQKEGEQTQGQNPVSSEQKPVDTGKKNVSKKNDSKDKADSTKEEPKNDKKAADVNKEEPKNEKKSIDAPLF